MILAHNHFTTTFRTLPSEYLTMLMPRSGFSSRRPSMLMRMVSRAVLALVPAMPVGRWRGVMMMGLSS